MKKIKFVKTENGLNVDDGQFQNVLKKAIAEKPLVRATRFAGVYDVRSSGGDFYQVSFWREGGDFCGKCECKGAERGFYCYHFAAALMCHVAFVRAGVACAAVSVANGRVASASA